MVDWNKPVRVKNGRWFDVHSVTVSKENPEVAALIWFESNGAIHAATFSANSSLVCNIPAAPKLVAWTLNEALERWQLAFRRKGTNNTLRLYLYDGALCVGSNIVTLQQLADEYECSGRPWENDSWRPCGREE